MNERAGQQSREGIPSRGSSIYENKTDWNVGVQETAPHPATLTPDCRCQVDGPVVEGEIGKKQGSDREP